MVSNQNALFYRDMCMWCLIKEHYFKLLSIRCLILKRNGYTVVSNERAFFL